MFTLEGVLADLKKGHEFSTGGGRWSHTFSWVDGKLMRHTFDEGLNFDEEVGEAELVKDLANDDFRRWP